MLRSYKIDVLVLDPLYLNLPEGVNPSSASDVGRWLRQLADACAQANVTLCVVAHSLKSIRPGRYLNLQQMSGAGVGEFVRSWILVNRRQNFDLRRPDVDELLINAGSSDVGAMSCRATIRHGKDTWRLDLHSEQEENNAGQKPIILKGNPIARNKVDHIEAAIRKLGQDEWHGVTAIRREAKRSSGTVSDALAALQSRGVIEAVSSGGGTLVRLLAAPAGG